MKKKSTSTKETKAKAAKHTKPREQDLTISLDRVGRIEALLENLGSRVSALLDGQVALQESHQDIKRALVQMEERISDLEIRILAVSKETDNLKFVQREIRDLVEKTNFKMAALEQRLLRSQDKAVHVDGELAKIKSLCKDYERRLAIVETSAG